MPSAAELFLFNDLLLVAYKTDNKSKPTKIQKRKDSLANLLQTPRDKNDDHDKSPRRRPSDAGVGRRPSDAGTVDADTLLYAGGFQLTVLRMSPLPPCIATSDRMMKLSGEGGDFAIVRFGDVVVMSDWVEAIRLAQQANINIPYRSSSNGE